MSVKIKNNLGLVVILILALGLRLYRLDYLELFGDELDAGYQAYSLLLTGRDYKGNQWPVYIQSFSEWRAPALMYSMVPFVAVFGLNEWGVRMTTVFWGMASLFMFYKWLRLIGCEKRIGLMAMFVLAVAPWHIQYSRVGFELTMMSTLIIAGLYGLVKFLDKWRWRWGLVSASCLVVSLYTYNTANIYVPALCLVVLGIMGKKGKLNWSKILVWLGLCFVLTLPLLGNVLKGEAASRFKLFSVFGHEELVSDVIKYRQIGGSGLLSRLFYNRYSLALRRIVFNYMNSWGADFLFFSGDVTYRHSLHQVGNLPWIWAPVMVLAVWFLIKSNKSKRWGWGTKIMLAWLLLSPLPSSLTIDGHSHASRLFLMVFPLAFLTAVGLNWLWKKNTGLFLVVACLWIFSFIRFEYFYWRLYKIDSWRWWHVGYKELIQSVKQKEGDYEGVRIENSYEPALIRYLFWSMTDPEIIFGLDDSQDQFCIKNKICFIRYEDNFWSGLVKGVLYVVSHERNVGGDWDWEKNPPEQVTVLDTIRNSLSTPLFYVIEKKTKD